MVDPVAITAGSCLVNPSTLPAAGVSAQPKPTHATATLHNALTSKVALADAACFAEIQPTCFALCDFCR